jgi:chemotaxis protein methyltransferase CheR
MRNSIRHYTDEKDSLGFESNYSGYTRVKLACSIGIYVRRVSLLDYREFKSQVGRLIKIDLSQYKSQQMDRRIHSFMPLWNVTNYDDYYNVLCNDEKIRNDFINKLTINVSEFFRNPERFAELGRTILPDLLKRQNSVRIWSAGCSDGSEPYSVAIIVKELKAESQVYIMATDIDKAIIQRAKNGVYVGNEVKSMPTELVTKYFKPETNNMYRLDESVKKMVEFKLHNLLCDPFSTNFDLIICRNVVIYFTEEAKNVLYYKFIASLRPGGYMLVGGTEPILQYRNFGLEHSVSSFYRKPLTK